jgi:3-polyprenyl-4-hydroxybenzoate decarboxylase
MRIFLGVTGASGAPYTARILEALTEADCEVGVCASSAGMEVLATELYGNARLSRDENLSRLLEHAHGEVTCAERVDDLVDFVAARALDQLGLDNALIKRWGDA